MDITERLRRWTIATDAVPASDIMDEAADEIERLRSVTESMPKEKLAEVSRFGTWNSTSKSPCTLSECTSHSARTLLSDAERQAIGHAADLLIGSRPGATLRLLLARTQTVAK